MSKKDIQQWAEGLTAAYSEYTVAWVAAESNMDGSWE
jgi:hypothetical protein